MSDCLIGGSPAIKRIKASLTKLSADTSPLVIIGEPGVGKSLLSARIHAHSLFKHTKLETVNFKILSERDQRIALLGGSPPELPTTRRSALELPTTVVLKHLDCASRFLQEQLVTAIQNGTIARLGTKEQRPSRCRLIFVYNKPLSMLSKEDRLASFLFKFLIKYPIIELPPLKKRKEDIPELAQHFFTQFQIQRHKRTNPSFVRLLQRNTWNENILELKAFILTLRVLPDEFALQHKNRIELAKMNLMVDEGREFNLKKSISNMEKEIIYQALKKHGDCQSKAAKSLGITDRTIRFIIE